MRIAFYGSAPFAVPTLKALCQSNHEVVVVYTQPDRPAGRGGKIRMTEVKKIALKLGIPVSQPENMKDGTALASLKEANVDLAVIVAYGHLIPKAMLEVPPSGFINLHASILPRYRGAAPVPHAILNGEKKTGVTVFKLNEKFDCGDILTTAETEITSEDTTETVLARLMEIGPELVITVVNEMGAGWAQPVPQSEEKACKAPKMKKEDGLIDWELPPERIDCLCRAFQPWPLAYSYIKVGRKTVRISVLKVSEAENPGDNSPGMIISADSKKGILVACGSGALWLDMVKPEGKKEMTGAEYMRGARLESGMVFDGPQK